MHFECFSLLNKKRKIIFSKLSKSSPDDIKVAVTKELFNYIMYGILFYISLIVLSLEECLVFINNYY